MTRRYLTRFAPLLLASTLVSTLGSCGGSTPDRIYCPSPFTVQDAQSLTHFTEGGGRDPRDIAYEAVLVSSSTTCEAARGQVAVNLIMRIRASAGPSVGASMTRVPYFVRVIDGSGRVVQGQEFVADFRLTSSNPVATSQEELSLRLPSGDSGSRIAVGLKPTQQELDYNRRAAAGGR